MPSRGIDLSKGRKEATAVTSVSFITGCLFGQLLEVRPALLTVPMDLGPWCLGPRILTIVKNDKLNSTIEIKDNEGALFEFPLPMFLSFLRLSWQ